MWGNWFSVKKEEREREREREREEWVGRELKTSTEYTRAKVDLMYTNHPLIFGYVNYFAV